MNRAIPPAGSWEVCTQCTLYNLRLTRGGIFQIGPPVAEILKPVQTFAPGANAFAPGANALHRGQIRYPRGKPGGIVFAPGVNYLPPDKIEGASFCPAKVGI